MREKFEKAEARDESRGDGFGNAELSLTGGMKVNVVQCTVAGSCQELFNTGQATKVHGKRSQRSARVRDRFRVPGIDCTGGTCRTLAHPFSISHEIGRAHV